MLAKDKLEQLKKDLDIVELDKKILDALSLDLVMKKEVSKDDFPKDSIILSSTYDEKIVKVNNGQVPEYYIEKNRYDGTKYSTVTDYLKITLVEDYDTYINEIKSISLTPNNTLSKNSLSYMFVLTIAIIVLTIGLIGGVIIISELDTVIGLASIISSASLSAILFALAKIIALISANKK